MASSRPTKADQAGFTLLEVEVAILVLSLLILGFSKLMGAHEQLASEMDSWCQGEPTYYIEMADDALLRALGAPGVLVIDEPAGLSGPPAPDAYEVEILSWSQTLLPPASTCTVLLTENP